ncbi:SigE family RNA polymerase sigma factor [Luedemannella flava]|uniref:SigE family RNA polymerase sigma factor n=1 Tax=Luedemannella flava TaxID=349316 RepID=A0ABN2M9I4_9ACTN
MSRQREFDEFVLTRSPRLSRTAYLLTRDWVAAEDLLQTALAKAWFAWPRMNGDPEPYVRRILANTYASRWRRRWTGEHPRAQLPDGGRQPADARDELWRSLGRLPRRQRLVLVLRYFEDLSEKEAAEIMRCSVGRVRSQTAKALAKLNLDRTPGVYA